MLKYGNLLIFPLEINGIRLWKDGTRLQKTPMVETAC